MLAKGRFVVKLPQRQVDVLIAAGDGSGSTRVTAD